MLNTPMIPDLPNAIDHPKAATYATQEDIDRLTERLDNLCEMVGTVLAEKGLAQAMLRRAVERAQAKCVVECDPMRDSDHSG